MKLSRLIMVLSATIGLSSTALARGEGRGGGHGHGRDELAIEKQFSLEKLKKLDLTKEQKEKLKDLREAHKNDAEKLREELKAAKKSFKEALRSNASKEDVVKLYEAMMDKKLQVGKARITGLLEAREVLTPAQREKLFENKE